ncbi:cation-translocating P-type ATPase [Roseateles sp. DAIF2]|uniref:heavy metal translocating P-type ATPase n=1 Tax=Roseateles sp. DAIF2 TaxID=2714952 RepID=UPI0018A2AA49|nr:cation-translocating P-type ATPase [Roseateles sp. DAIF2]QPF76109.1 cation-translocating P-type ATPase [Roseateles sp. DAIF2]
MAHRHHDHPAPAPADSTCCGGHSHHDHGHDAPAAAGASAPPEAAAGARRSRLYIAGMDCPTEEALLRQALTPLPGVAALHFDLLGRVLSVDHHLDDEAPLLRAVAATGMQARALDEAKPAPTPGPAVSRRQRWLMGLAGVAAVAAEALAFAGWGDTHPAVVLLVLATLGLGGLPTLRKGVIALRHLQLNIHLLMSLAVIGAIILGQWPEAAMVVWLFGLAEMLEALSLERARKAIQALAALAPESALMLQGDGQWQPREAALIPLGARLRVRPGERVALDGRVLSGESSVDEAAISGESLPVAKGAGDLLLAGSVNQAGLLEMEVTAPKGQTLLDRMAEAVQQAQGQRAPTQRFVDRFARIYTPIVVLGAVALAVLPPLLMAGQDWSDWFYRALVLLVIACPCALVISTPVTIVSGLTAAARRGLLIKGGLYLEQGRHLKTIALDKTGTLTEGRPVLTDALALDTALERGQVLHIAASLAALSTHPASAAIVAAHDAKDLPLLTVDSFESLAGRGLAGSIDDQTWLLGSARLMRERGLPDGGAERERLEAEGKTVNVLAREGQPVALLAVADPPRADSAAVIRQLHELGLRCVMLSGDNPGAAAAVGRAVGLDEVHGGLLPDDKLAAIAALPGPVAMVGDGINDAPALARADIGIAMGAGGTAIAIEAADVALMQDDLRRLPEFIALSRRSAAVLWQNIVLALGLKAVVLLMTLFGLGSLWLAVFADAGASALVVLNGLRLLRWRGLATTKPTAR